MCAEREQAGRLAGRGGGGGGEGPRDGVWLADDEERDPLLLVLLLRFGACHVVVLTCEAAAGGTVTHEGAPSRSGASSAPLVGRVAAAWTQTEGIGEVGGGGCELWSRASSAARGPCPAAASSPSPQFVQIDAAAQQESSAAGPRSCSSGRLPPLPSQQLVQIDAAAQQESSAAAAPWPSSASC